MMGRWGLEGMGSFEQARVAEKEATVSPSTVEGKSVEAS